MPESNPSAAGQQPGVLWTRLLPALLLLLFAAQCAWFIGTQSITADEPFHIDSGQDAWRDGQFKERDDNPPLARLWFTALVSGPEFEIVKQAGQPVQEIRPSPEALLWRTRGMNALLGVLLGAVLWCTVRRLYSAAAANFALALYAQSPALITHFSLATHDGPVTLMIFLAGWQLVRWRAHPTRLNALLLGLALGAMLVSKHNAAAMFALALALLLILKPQGWTLHPVRWNWKTAAVVTLVAGMVVWGAYFFHVSQVTVRGGQLVMSFPNYDQPFLRAAPAGIHATLYVPAGEYWTGIFKVARNSRYGFESYLLGENYVGGKRHFFPLVMALKWPPLVLLLALAGGALLALRKAARPAGLGVVLLFPTAYFALAVASRMNFGDRHILPVYPFLLLLAAAAWEAARQRRSRALLAGLALVVALQAADTARYAPDYLTYFNPFIDPAKSYQYLTDSNLDWGQGLLALKKYEGQHPEEQMHLAYFGNVAPQSVYGIRATPLRDGEYPSGTVVVSARHLSGYTHKDRWNYHWVEKYPRKAILGHVLHVFEVPEGPELEELRSRAAKSSKPEIEDGKK
jgi:4-amino-4-deoxy-L-arabinose transferase-like glycosyltransferase